MAGSRAAAAAGSFAPGIGKSALAARQLASKYGLSAEPTPKRSRIRLPAAHAAGNNIPRRTNALADEAIGQHDISPDAEQKSRAALAKF